MSIDMLSKNKALNGFDTTKYGLRFASFGAICVLLAACSSTPQHIKSAAPKAYNERHPIVVSEAPTNLDLPVGAERTHLTPGMKSAITGFAAEYHRSGAKGLDILVPSGSKNETAAGHIAKHARTILVKKGVPENRISLLPYKFANASLNGNVRLTYSAIKAHVPSECGVWPTDIGQQVDNQNYENFGCATQSNLAAIIADPNDLITPRGNGEINAERSANVLETFESNEVPTITPIVTNDVFE